ncbi:hypothetical protein Tco_0692408 [Tanacetum coccineum]
MLILIDKLYKLKFIVSWAFLDRGGLEAQQLDHLMGLVESTLLSNSEDRWVWDLNGDGVFRVKDVRNLLDETFLPKADTPTEKDEKHQPKHKTDSNGKTVKDKANQSRKVQSKSKSTEKSTSKPKSTPLAKVKKKNSS